MSACVRAGGRAGGRACVRACVRACMCVVVVVAKKAIFTSAQLSSEKYVLGSLSFGYVQLKLNAKATMSNRKTKRLLSG